MRDALPPRDLFFDAEDQSEQRRRRPHRRPPGVSNRPGGRTIRPAVQYVGGIELQLRERPENSFGIHVAGS